jgi:hypothetical protein
LDLELGLVSEPYEHQAKSLQEEPGAGLICSPMALIYERTETDEKVVIRYKHLPGVMIVRFLGFFCMIYFLMNRETLVGTGFFVAIMSLHLLWIAPQREVKKAKLRGGVMVSGSMWSFSNPLTITIPRPTGDDRVE